MGKIPVVVVGPFGKKLGLPVIEALLAAPDEFELLAGVIRSDDNTDRRLGDVQLVNEFNQIKGKVTSLSDQLIYDHLVEAVVFYAVKADALAGRLREADYHCFKSHVIGTTGLNEELMHLMEIYTHECGNIIICRNGSRC